jgi:hypothetical protein
VFAEGATCGVALTPECRARLLDVARQAASTARTGPGPSVRAL